MKTHSPTGLLAVSAIFAIVWHAFQLFAVTPTADEMSQRSAWLYNHFGSRAAAAALSFSYDGRAATPSLLKWKRTTSTQSFTDRTLHVMNFTDPQTGLIVRSEVIEFRDDAAVEWVVHLKNTGSTDTPILSDIRALDTVMTAPNEPAVLHYARGALCSMDDFAPLTEQPSARIVTYQPVR